jgi:twitching motility protein PilI
VELQMPEKSKHAPFEILLSLERASNSLLKGQSADQELDEEWSGIGFELRRTSLLAPMTHVSEVFTPQVITTVPGVKPWVLGISNVRGNLLPVFDLQGLLYGKNASIDIRQQRIMVVNHAAVASGLLVDAVLGIKHFRVEDRYLNIEQLDSELKPFVNHAYREADKQYAVFEVAKLIESEKFLDVAV